MKRPDRSSRRGFLGSLRRAEEAATLAFTAVALGVLLGSAALAVDLGMLIASRVQSQRAADSGALAGASQLATTGGTAAMARNEAKLFANKHNVLSSPVNVQDGDVDVDLIERRVRVRVRHDVPVLFARIMGNVSVTVSTVAAAEVQPAGDVSCPIPIAAVDKWIDQPPFNGQYDPTPAPGEYYEPCRPTLDTDGDGEPDAPSPSCTGFRYDDEGALLEIKTKPSSSFDPTQLEQTCQATSGSTSGWFCFLLADAGGGAAGVKDIIRGCTGGHTLNIALGDYVDSKTGNVQSAVHEIGDLIDQNGGTNVQWDGTCVRDNSSGQCYPQRLRALPLVDPTTISGNGSQATAQVSNMAGAYLVKVADCATCPHKKNGDNVYVQLVQAAPDAVGRSADADEGSLLKTIVLVE